MYEKNDLYQVFSPVDISTLNILYIQITQKKTELYFDLSINDQNCAFDHQSMIITAVVNHF